MDKRSKRLSSEERGVIFADLDRGSSQRVIGTILGRPASTVYRNWRLDVSHCPTAARPSDKNFALETGI